MPGNIETPKINRNSKILEYLDAVIYNIINVFKKFENELENERLIIQATETKKNDLDAYSNIKQQWSISKLAICKDKIIDSQIQPTTSNQQ